MSRAQEVIAAHANLEGAVLPILHALQAEFGYVPPDSLPLVADALNLSRAELHGIATFYHDFRSSPPAPLVVKLCRAEACQARGGEALAAYAEAQASPGLAIEPIYCLGLCASGPAGFVDGALHARLTPTRLDALIEAAR